MSTTVIPAAPDRTPATGYLRSLQTLDHEIAVDDLAVTGKLPDWLAGTLVRNGPGCFEVGSDHYRHWFDGLAMLHRFSVANGRVSYANRYLRSPGYVESHKLGKITGSEFDTDPKTSLLGRLTALGHKHDSHNANVSVVPWGEGMLALTETPSPVAFDLMSLETLGVRTFTDDIPAQISTAHLQYDAANDRAYNVLTEVGRRSMYHVVAIAPGTFERRKVGSIALDEPGYLHSFAMTERYVVVAEFPLVVNPLALAFRRKPFIENFRWEPTRGTRFFVVSKADGRIAATYDADAFFAFHHVNAYEEGDAIVLDVSAYPDASVVSALSLARLADPANDALGTGTLRRYRLAPGSSTATYETLSNASVELPAVDRRRLGRSYRYAYGIDATAVRPNPLPDAIVRVDTVDRTTSMWTSPGAIPGEPLFVARPGATDEDDGVLLAVVFDTDRGRSFLLALDARTLSELARAYVPHHIPLGFHGVFRRSG